MQNTKIIDILKNGRVHISCEVFPPEQGGELKNCFEIVKQIAQFRPSYMSVTYRAGRMSVERSLPLAEEVQKYRLPALAHITCIQSDEAEITNVLTDFKNHGIRNVLALRGDMPDNPPAEFEANQHRFRHADELMRFIKEQGDFCIGGAVYPEGHPEAGSLERDIKNTQYKIDAGVDFFVTQMFFDNNILYNYMFRLLSAGIDIPVVPGIMPVTNAKQIQRICRLSGTKLPLQFRSMVEKFADKPKALKQAGIAFATGQIIDLIANGFNNIHIYTMNKPEIFGGIMNNLSDIVDKNEDCNG